MHEAVLLKLPKFSREIAQSSMGQTRTAIEERRTTNNAVPCLEIFGARTVDRKLEMQARTVANGTPNRSSRKKIGTGNIAYCASCSFGCGSNRTKDKEQKTFGQYLIITSIW